MTVIIITDPRKSIKIACPLVIFFELGDFVGTVFQTGKSATKHVTLKSCVSASKLSQFFCKHRSQKSPILSVELIRLEAKSIHLCSVHRTKVSTLRAGSHLWCWRRPVIPISKAVSG
jgi:hypothetical protein